MHKPRKKGLIEARKIGEIQKSANFQYFASKNWALLQSAARCDFKRYMEIKTFQTVPKKQTKKVFLKQEKRRNWNFGKFQFIARKNWASLQSAARRYF